MHRVLGVVLLGVCVNSAGLLREGCVAQKPVAPPSADYDYQSLAITSILSSAEEASKLPNIEQRVTILVSAAKILPSSRRDDAVGLLDLALRDLNEWVSQDNISNSHRYAAAQLRSAVLSTYSQLDAERAMALQKEDQASGSDKGTAPLRPNGGWSAAIFEKRKPADEAVKIALSILDTDPERAVVLVTQSVRFGIISNNIPVIVQKLQQSGNRSLLSRLEVGIAEALASNVTLDPFSLRSASVLASDAAMSPVARSAFVSFFINSLQTWVSLIEDEDRNGGLDPSYISSVFIAFSVSVRTVVAQCAPMELVRFDLLLDRISGHVPAKTKALIPLASPESISDPKERLADIVKEPDAEKRDIRLMRLLIESLRKNTTPDSNDDWDFALETIEHVSDANLKTNLSDFVTIARLDGLVKHRRFNDAARLTASITSLEVRAWSMLALSAVVGKEDRFMRTTLVNNAIKALDVASPSPRRFELALLAAAILVKDDTPRSFEILSAAVRYANSAPSGPEKKTYGLSSAIQYEVSVGSMRAMLTRPPAALTEVSIDPSLSLLAKADWFGAQKITDGFKDLALRLTLKLQLAKGAITSDSKPKVNPASQKQPSIG